MAVLNISQLSGILVNMWVKIISVFSSGVASYAWAIVLLTVAIKLVMTPLDFFNKKVSRKNAQMQKVLQPQLEKLKKQYGHDQALYNQKMTELYKSNNYSVMGSCLFMLVNLVLTFTIFISLLNGLNVMASARIKNQYEELKQTYNQTITQQVDLGKTEEQAVVIANKEVVIKYNEVKESWLWIKNIWKADTTTNSIPNFDEYVSIAKTFEIDDQSVEFKNLTNEQKEAFKVEYETIMNPLREKEGKANGYYILLILILGSTILTQFLSQRKLSGKKEKKEGAEQDPTAGVNKMMMFLLPVLLGSFALTSNAAFAIYMLVSQLIALATTPLIDFIIDKTNDKVFLKKKASSAPSYSRENVNFPKEETKNNSKKKGDK